MKRVFIVGSPRAGTTLLQGLLAAHPEVYSLPETHFFARTLSRNPLRRYLLWPALKVRRRLFETVREQGRSDLLPLAKIGVFQRDYHTPFVRVMDQMARDAGKTVWVEKTPMHLHCLSEIQKRIPDAEIIHITRQGRDVVTSLVKATNARPDHWTSFGGMRWLGWHGFSVEDAVKRWNKDFQITMEQLGKPRNTVIKFEDVVARPDAVARQLCTLLGLDYQQEMTNPAISYRTIVRTQESWKANNARAIGDRKYRSKQPLDESVERYIENRLISYDV